MTVYPFQARFTSGELSPLLHAQVDLDVYKTALKTGINWTATKHGNLRKRPGFQMVKETRTLGSKVRLLPFTFSTDQAYVLEVGDGYIRPLTRGGVIGTAGGTPTAITRANPCVVTIAGHGLADGEPLFASGIGGMFEIDNREFTAANVTADTFELQGVDSTSYTAFTSGGTIRRIVEAAAPYAEAHLSTIDYAGAGDVMGLTHADYKPQELVRDSETLWTIGDIAFVDGPYDEFPAGAAIPHATLQDYSGSMSMYGALHPKMTSNTAPYGTLTSSPAPSLNAIWNAFDHSIGSPVTYPGTTGQFEYVLPVAASPPPVNCYWITSSTKGNAEMPSAWYIEGYDGSAWQKIDHRQRQISWGSGETRYYDFENNTIYTGFRFKWYAVADDTAGQMTIQQIAFGSKTDDQGIDSRLVFSSTDFINGGAGFDNGDVGRHIRIEGLDGKYRWFEIDGKISANTVTGFFHGYPLIGYNRITRWRLGTWKATNYPKKIGFYERRRAFANSRSSPFSLWLTQTEDFYNHGVSQPIDQDDAIAFRILSGRADPISWIAEADRLVLGTKSGLRAFGKGSDSAGFGPTNVSQEPRIYTGSNEIKPINAGNALLCVDTHGKAVREFVYSLEQQAYAGPELSVLSEHLFLAGIVDWAFQQSPDNIAWIVLADGGLVSLTYDREQKIASFLPQQITGGDPGTTAMVESVAAIPGDGQDDIYISVKRTVGGVERRYIEVLSPVFRGGALADAMLLDSAMSYSGAATGTVTGLWHLRGLTVWALADGAVYKNLTVSATGSLTLPNGTTASKITVGLPYTATLTTLALNDAGQPDGAGKSRPKILHDVRVSVFEALGLKAKGLATSQGYDVFPRDALLGDGATGPQALRTGEFRVNFDTSWRDDGQFTLYSDDPLPCTIRGVTLAANGEP